MIRLEIFCNNSMQETDEGQTELRRDDMGGGMGLEGLLNLKRLIEAGGLICKGFGAVSGRSRQARDSRLGGGQRLHITHECAARCA